MGLNDVAPGDRMRWVRGMGRNCMTTDVTVTRTTPTRIMINRGAQEIAFNRNNPYSSNKAIKIGHKHRDGFNYLEPVDNATDRERVMDDLALAIVDQDPWPTPDTAISNLMAFAGCSHEESAQALKALHESGRIVAVTVDGFQFFTTPERQARHNAGSEVE